MLNGSSEDKKGGTIGFWSDHPDKGKGIFSNSDVKGKWY